MTYHFSQIFSFNFLRLHLSRGESFQEEQTAPRFGSQKWKFWYFGINYNFQTCCSLLSNYKQSAGKICRRDRREGGHENPESFSRADFATELRGVEVDQVGLHLNVWELIDDHIGFVSVVSAGECLEDVGDWVSLSSPLPDLLPTLSYLRQGGGD